MSIPSTQILVSVYKVPGLMGGMPDSRTGEGKVQTNWNILEVIKYGSPQEIKGTYQKDTGARLKGLPLANSRAT